MNNHNPDMDFGFYAAIPRIVRTGYKTAIITLASGEKKEVKLTHAHKCIYGYLKDLCGESGTCYRTLRSLAKETDASTGFLSEAIPILHAAGLIHAEKKKRRTGGKEVWHITITDIWQANGKVHPTKRSQNEQSQEAECSLYEQTMTVTDRDVHSMNKNVQNVNKSTPECSEREQECSFCETEVISISNINNEVISVKQESGADATASHRTHTLENSQSEEMEEDGSRIHGDTAAEFHHRGDIGGIAGTSLNSTPATGDQTVQAAGNSYSPRRQQQGEEVDVRSRNGLPSHAGLRVPERDTRHSALRRSSPAFDTNGVGDPQPSDQLPMDAALPRGEEINATNHHCDTAFSGHDLHSDLAPVHHPDASDYPDMGNDHVPPLLQGDPRHLERTTPAQQQTASSLFQRTTERAGEVVRPVSADVDGLSKHAVSQTEITPSRSVENPVVVGGNATRAGGKGRAKGDASETRVGGKTRKKAEKPKTGLAAHTEQEQAFWSMWLRVDQNRKVAPQYKDSATDHIRALAPYITTQEELQALTEFARLKMRQQLKRLDLWKVELGNLRTHFAEWDRLRQQATTIQNSPRPSSILSAEKNQRNLDRLRAAVAAKQAQQLAL